MQLNFIEKKIKIFNISNKDKNILKSMNYKTSNLRLINVKTSFSCLKKRKLKAFSYDKNTKGLKNTRIKEWFVYCGVGFISGFINGLFGAGGGTFVVPSLVYFLGYKQKKAQATAILIILPLCIVSTLVYILQGIYDIKTTLSTGGGVIIGGILGALVMKKLKNIILSYIFYVLMLVAGVKMIIG